MEEFHSFVLPRTLYLKCSFGLYGRGPAALGALVSVAGHLSHLDPAAVQARQVLDEGPVSEEPVGHRDGVGELAAAADCSRLPPRSSLRTCGWICCHLRPMVN